MSAAILNGRDAACAVGVHGVVYVPVNVAVLVCAGWLSVPPFSTVTVPLTLPELSYSIRKPRPIQSSHRRSIWCRYHIDQEPAFIRIESKRPC